MSTFICSNIELGFNAAEPSLNVDDSTCQIGWSWTFLTIPAFNLPQLWGHGLTWTEMHSYKACVTASCGSQGCSQNGPTGIAIEISVFNFPWLARIEWPFRFSPRWWRWRSSRRTLNLAVRWAVHAIVEFFFLLSVYGFKEWLESKVSVRHFRFVNRFRGHYPLWHRFSQPGPLHWQGMLDRVIAGLWLISLSVVASGFKRLCLLHDYCSPQVSTACTLSLCQPVAAGHWEWKPYPSLFPHGNLQTALVGTLTLCLCREPQNSTRLFWVFFFCVFFGTLLYITSSKLQWYCDFCSAVAFTKLPRIRFIKCVKRRDELVLRGVKRWERRCSQRFRAESAFQVRGDSDVSI